ncbi:MAG: UrcA family protein [Erythrobacter sp.]
MKTLALASAAFGLVFAVTPAMAGTAEYRTQQISVAGLDLETAEGQRMLEQRVERAAREVCGYDRVQIGTRIRSNESRECFAKAKSNARQQVAAMIENQRRGG